MKSNLYAQFRAFLMAAVAMAAGAPQCGAQSYTITTAAGSGEILATPSGVPAQNAILWTPSGVAADSAGNLYIADSLFSSVFKVTPDGSLSVYAGLGSSASSGYSGDGGPANKALLSLPSGVAVDSAGNVYIADLGNGRVRKVTPSGTITTFAGKEIVGLDSGDGGPATQAALSNPHALAVDASGNLYISDTFSIRKVTPGGMISTVAGNVFPTGAGLGDGTPAIGASVEPKGVAVDSSGNLYFSDQWQKNAARKVSPAGIITTVAGTTAGSFQGDGGPATSAGLNQPDGVAVDSAGNIFIADRGDNRVRMVKTDGTITTIAGTGELRTSGDGGPATNAALTIPTGIAVASGGTIYISDQSNNQTPDPNHDSRVRKLTPAGGAPGAPPAIQSGGVVSAGAFGPFSSVAPGSWIEIYGTSLAASSRSWAGTDFSGVTSPTALDGTKVTVGGQNAFIDYISPTQVNAQVPSSVLTGSQPVVVTTSGGASGAFSIQVNAAQPGLLSPSSFNIGGKQYAAALLIPIKTTDAEAKNGIEHRYRMKMVAGIY
jgi:sugar lactone lactonase YvrE